MEVLYNRDNFWTIMTEVSEEAQRFKSKPFINFNEEQNLWVCISRSALEYLTVNVWTILLQLSPSLDTIVSWPDAASLENNSKCQSKVCSLHGRGPCGVDCWVVWCPTKQERETIINLNIYIFQSSSITWASGITFAIGIDSEARATRKRSLANAGLEPCIYLTNIPTTDTS